MLSGRTSIFGVVFFPPVAISYATEKTVTYKSCLTYLVLSAFFQKLFWFIQHEGQCQCPQDSRDFLGIDFCLNYGCA